MFSSEFEKVLNDANRLAMDYKHPFIDVEHLLYILIDTAECTMLLHSLGIKASKISEKLDAYFEKNPIRNMSTQTDGNAEQIEHSDAFKRVIQRAIFHAQAMGQSEVSCVFVLVAILSQSHTHAYQILHDVGINKVVVAHLLQQKESRYDIIMPSENEMPAIPSMPNEQSAQDEESLIKMYTINLNEQVIAGKIDPIFERAEEITRVEKVLCRRTKNNPLLVGEPGVGKTAIAEGLAAAIVQGKVSRQLRRVKIYVLDLGSLLAGTKYRGDFEKRFKAVLHEFTSRPDAVMFIDEVHSIIGAGAASGGSLDAANLMKPLLSRGKLRCIGATTFQEYKQIFDKDKALSRRFQKIDICEPNEQQTMHILKGLKHKYEQHHGVQYSQQALKATLLLSSRYLHDRFLPDKAFDILDEAGSGKSLSTQHQDAQKTPTVDARDIEKVVAEMARIPRHNMNFSERKQLVSLERDLNMFVYGQEQAITQIAASIKLARSGLSEPNKPVGSFLFTGPSGVGKTELAKQLASILNLKLLRFDMSEYMDKHASSQLIGAPAGYVGYDQGGKLTDAIIKNPYSVLLLDEVEKAHPDLLNLLLQVMDNGQLSDNIGRIADFRHVIIIMTSNSGAQGFYKSDIGFSPKESDSKDIDHKQLHASFSPEFRNRLSGIVTFNPLKHAQVLQVVDKFISAFEVQLSQQHVDLMLGEGVREYLFEKGYDHQNGARPISRIIDTSIKKPIADALLKNELKNGDTAFIRLRGGQLLLEVKHKKIAAGM